MLIGFLALTARAAEPGTSEWVHPGPDGKLVYKTTPAGDRVMDFSYAGYMGGGVALPTVEVKRTVKPSGGEDDTALIQTAIDEVAQLPLERGFRGAVLLGPGTFNCAQTIAISASGVVLRGSGSGAGKDGGPTTTIKMTGKPHLAIAVRGPGTGGRGAGVADEQGASVKTSIADTYVPSGATSFSVADAKGFAVGDTIAIRKPVTAAWVKFMQMDDMTRDGKPQTWIKTGSTVTAERRVTTVAGNRITVEVPLSDSFDAKYLNPPGTAVVKIKPPARLSQVGVESLHVECPPQEISHTQPHFTALRLNGEDCWARDLVIDETMNSVGVGGRRITLERVAVNRKAKHQGSSRPAEFAPNGSQVLMDRCTVSADNVWFVATGAGVSGPVVVLNCTFTGGGRAESHQRWSTGMLYDNCRAPDGGFEFRNRGSMGSGHGWSMGWGVMWNCEAKDYVVQNPPGAVNWLIGSRGENKPMPRPFGTGPALPEGVKDSAGAAVTPKSLYLAQLAERLGAGAVKAIGY
jgi:hypothetical protein